MFLVLKNHVKFGHRFNYFDLRQFKKYIHFFFYKIDNIKLV